MIYLVFKSANKKKDAKAKEPSSEKEPSVIKDEEPEKVDSSKSKSKRNIN